MTGDDYLEMLQNWLLDGIESIEHAQFIFQQDGAPPHWKLTVRAYLNEKLPGRWIGRAVDGDNVLLKWPPRSPDLTPCDFFLWGYVKGLVYVPPLPTCVEGLKERITEALKTVTQDMLQRVWQELDYRLDVCRLTSGAHIENM